MSNSTYLTELLGIPNERAMQAIENIEHSAQVTRAAATLHEIRRAMTSHHNEEEGWTSLSDLDKRWWVQVSSMGLLPSASWREHEWGEVQLRMASLRFDQLPPSVMLHFYWPQALATVHAMSKPGATIDSIARAAFESVNTQSYESTDPDIVEGTRRVTTVVLHALGAAEGLIGI